MDEGKDQDCSWWNVVDNYVQLIIEGSRNVSSGGTKWPCHWQLHVSTSSSCAGNKSAGTLLMSSSIFDKASATCVLSRPWIFIRTPELNGETWQLYLKLQHFHAGKYWTNHLWVIRSTSATIDATIAHLEFINANIARHYEGLSDDIAKPCSSSVVQRHATAPPPTIPRLRNEFVLPAHRKHNSSNQSCFHILIRLHEVKHEPNMALWQNLGN